MRQAVAAARSLVALVLAPAIGVLAAPAVARSRFSCSGGLTDSVPMCCSVGILGVVTLDCQICERYMSTSDSRLEYWLGI